jgi:hypothetical protein
MVVCPTDVIFSLRWLCPLHQKSVVIEINKKGRKLTRQKPAT